MTKRPPRLQPKWTDVKAKLAGLDRLGLVGLIQDLYAAGKDNQTFLHTRFGLGEDVLHPYRQTLERWLSPNVLGSQNISVTKAKQAISSYRKAVGDAAGLADLLVFYCECAADFSCSYGYQDEPYLGALIRMFEQAVKTTSQLPEPDHGPLLARLDRVRRISHDLGYGVGDSMDEMLVDAFGI